MALIAYDNLTLLPMATQNMIPSTQAPGWATKEAWERYRPLIVQLYANNKLEEVKRVMERDHGFKATTKMYKNHIKMWGLDKKHKENEMRAVIHKNHLRRKQGISSRFEIRGRPVEIADAVRYWKRKGVSVEEVLARRTASLTPEAVICLTPVTSLQSTPGELTAPERILLNIRDYFRGSFDSGTWVKTEPMTYCYSRKIEIACGGDAYELFDHISAAINLFGLKRFADAGQELNVAHSHIKGTLQSERPDILHFMFRSICQCLETGNYGIATVTLRQLCCLGSVVLGAQHPLGVVCGLLASLEPLYCAEFLVKTIESITVCLEEVLGPTHTTTLEYARISMNIEARTDVYQARTKAEQTLQNLETQLDLYDRRLANLRLTLAEVLIIGQDYMEAEQVAQEMLLYAPPGKVGLAIRAQGHYIQALAHKIYGETLEAELKLRECIDAHAALGDDLARRPLFTYAQWLTEWGCPDEADRVLLTVREMTEPVEVL